ncbi:MAG: hypothetical protein ACD_2C00273G0001 [uncultured bacterium (gcode 4)]|uniref:Uncharacterized protein n=1 Tax=uncultured bacterium (gcode 4) TaxID=1234023 RepID=K2GZE4_9BACT|nr:MAG: hypothetical protein ACD_2C00273G0001 [uncultured bacterium (gcode 4)]
MRKGEVTIAEMSIKVTVIAFALKSFKQDEIQEIEAYISANPFYDDLAMNGGQVVADSQLNILYTGSAGAAMYIAMAYSRKSLKKKHTITVYKKVIPDDSVPLIMAMVAIQHQKKRRRKKKKVVHNLQPVLDEMKRGTKTETKKK